MSDYLKHHEEITRKIISIIIPHFSESGLVAVLLDIARKQAELEYRLIVLENTVLDSKPKPEMQPLT